MFHPSLHQAIISGNATCVQLRHILGALLTACAPTEDEAERQEQPSALPYKAPSPAPSVKSTASTGGCLAGKRKRQGSSSALIPSGAREVGVKRPTTAEGTKGGQSTSQQQS